MMDEAANPEEAFAQKRIAEIHDLLENITEWNRERYYQDVSLIEDSLTLEE